MCFHASASSQGSATFLDLWLISFSDLIVRHLEHFDSFLYPWWCEDTRGYMGLVGDCSWVSAHLACKGCHKDLSHYVPEGTPDIVLEHWDLSLTWSLAIQVRPVCCVSVFLLYPWMSCTGIFLINNSEKSGQSHINCQPYVVYVTCSMIGGSREVELASSQSHCCAWVRGLSGDTLLSFLLVGL